MDVLTLSIVNAFIAVTFTALLILQYKSEHQFRYQRYFILAAVLMFINAGLSALHGVIGLSAYWLVPALTNACSVSAHLALACGVHRHLQLPFKRQWLLLLFFPIYLAQLTDFASAATANRMLIGIPLVILFNLWSISMLWQHRKSELGKVYLAFIAIFAFNITQFFLRSTYMLLEYYQIVLTHQSALIHSIGYFSLTAFAVLMFGCVIMLSHTQQRQTLLHISERDALTGLLNRRSLHGRIFSELNRGLRHHKALSVLLFDIDHFKRINDSFGHRAGDQAILHIVDIASNQLRDYDLMFRYGGEEFLICLPDTTGETAELIANRLRKAIELTPMTQPVAVSMTVSIGITSTTEPVAVEELIEQADIALYNAKQSGRNKVVAYHQL